MPPKKIEKPSTTTQKQLQNTKMPEEKIIDDSFSQSSESSEESFSEPEVAPVVQEKPKLAPISKPKAERVRKTANDEELRELKRQHMLKIREIGNQKKTEMAYKKMEEAKKEDDRQKELLAKAKHEAYEEVYKKLLAEQTQAIKMEMNKKYKESSSKKKATAVKKLDALKQVEIEEPVEEPPKPKPTPRKTQTPAPAPAPTLKLTHAQMLSRFGF
jgi:hypothetical protein